MFAIQGSAFTSKTYDEVEYLENCLFEIDDQGFIASITHTCDESFSSKVNHYKSLGKLQVLQAGQYLLPGMIDLHIHAPQWAQSGTALDIPLYDWLNTYTFPLESRFESRSFAKLVYNDLIEQLIAAGTTTGAFFATVHPESTLDLAHICSNKGMRALIGKVVMDNPDQNPSYYCDSSTQAALSSTKHCIEALEEIGSNSKAGIFPVITPRFIPSCTNEALEGLGKLLETYNCYMQTHCSESDWEHNYVIDRFGKHDACVLDSFGLLGRKSLLAHCGHLSEEDAELLAKRKTSLVHCPISNAYFENAVTPILRWSKEKGLNCALATDISGGFSKSIFANIRQAVISSRMLEDGVNYKISPEKRGVSNSRITLNQAFYMATAGGGVAIDLPVGRLAKGYIWDALIIDTNYIDNRLPIFNEDEPALDQFQKILYMSESCNIRSVYIQGKEVLCKDKF